MLPAQEVLSCRLAGVVALVEAMDSIRQVRTGPLDAVLAAGLRNAMKAVINYLPTSGLASLLGSQTDISSNTVWPTCTTVLRAAEQEVAKTSLTGTTSRMTRTSAWLCRMSNNPRPPPPATPSRGVPPRDSFYSGWHVQRQATCCVPLLRRTYYLGHSIKALSGRWQNNKVPRSPCLLSRLSLTPCLPVCIRCSALAM